MAFKRLGAGTLTAAAQITAYAVPAKSTASVSRMVLTNNTANDVGVTVSVNDGATTRVLMAKTIPAGVGKTLTIYEAFDSYSGGDSILIEPDSADSINYLITGREV
jgi:hypothetical protein